MFEQFGFSSLLLKSIQRAGFLKPSSIQEKAIPLIMSGCDIVGQAKTGTGKTAAFALPALEKILKNRQLHVLIVTPTRELCIQIYNEINKFSHMLRIDAVPVYGGSSYSYQIKSIRNGAQIIIATPGRLLDLFKKKRIENFKPTFIVLDEADEMLDMGFLDDILDIFSHLPLLRQTLLFSATMPKAIQKLAEKILKNPKFILTNIGCETGNQNIIQFAFVINNFEREDALIRLIDFENPFKAIVFCKTRADVDNLNRTLSYFGYCCAALHGEIEQWQRESTILSFRNGNVQILIATDVASRGLDIVDISHIFNFNLPCDVETYIHRIGRTARAGRRGIAISLVLSNELHKFVQVQRKIGNFIIQKNVPTLSELKIKKLQELLKKLSNETTTPSVQGFLEKLQIKFTEKQLLTKLLSVLLQELEFSGPKFIGLNFKYLNQPRGKFSNCFTRTKKWRN